MNKFVKIQALVLITLGTFTSCATKREKAAQLEAALKIDALQKQITQLQNELDKRDHQIRNTRDIEKEINNLVVQSYNHEDYQSLYMYAGTAITLYPNSISYNAFYNYFNTAKTYLGFGEVPNVTPVYMDYSSETGIWKLGHFIDTYGNATSTPYITTANLLTGTFTNSSYTNAYLEVYPIISSQNDISFMLYELGGETEVKGTKRSPVYYEVSIKDGDGDSHTFKGTNNSDRITFDKSTSQKIHAYLLNGGFIQFVFKTTKDGYTSTYKFNIQDSSFYNNVYRQLYAEQH